MKTQYTNRQLRSFGLTVGGIFLVIGIWPLVRSGQAARTWSLVLGSVLLVPGILMPALLRQPYRAWMQLAHVLGWVNTKVILSIMFYAVFTPAAFIARLMGKDPMSRAFVPNADTYRVVRQPRDASHMKHQF